MQMDNDPKHTVKATKTFFKTKKWNVMQWPSQSPDLNPIEHAFQLLKTKLKGKCPKNKQELKTVAGKAWQSITRDETQLLVMSMRSRLQAVKSESLIYLISRGGLRRWFTNAMPRETGFSNPASAKG